MPNPPPIDIILKCDTSSALGELDSLRSFLDQRGKLLKVGHGTVVSEL